MRTTGLCATLVLVLTACPKPPAQSSGDAPDGSTPPGAELQGGGQGPDEPPPAGDDPCASVTLPACPAECTQPLGEMLGTACPPDQAKCGNNIGDGCECTDGKWECTVHKPLGGPGTCNLTCK